MTLAERRKQPLVFVASIESPVLSVGDERHLRSSLRLGDNDSITLSDGRGSYVFARLGAIAEPDSDLFYEAPLGVSLAVGFTPVKAHKPEWMVQKLTELGVDSIQPLLSDRSVVRWDTKKRAAIHDRLQVAAREAAMQCRRVHLPQVCEPRSVAEVIAESQRPVVFADPAGEPLRDPSALVLVGPEGGWSEREVSDAKLVALPGNVLRAETAVVVAGAALHGLRSGLFGPAAAT